MVILRCWIGLNHNWFKSYDTKRKSGGYYIAAIVAYLYCSIFGLSQWGGEKLQCLVDIVGLFMATIFLQVAEMLIVESFWVPSNRQQQNVWLKWCFKILTVSLVQPVYQNTILLIFWFYKSVISLLQYFVKTCFMKLKRDKSDEIIIFVQKAWSWLQLEIQMVST